MTRYATAIVVLMLAVVPVSAQAQTCRFLCEPTLLIEPTITFEKDDTVFKTIFALDLSTPIPRVGVTLEAITKPFSDENDVELESELKLYWLESDDTGGWVSSQFDIVDKFSGAEKPTDTRAYTHKLNLELDTAVALFSRLPETNWLHDVEIEDLSTMSPQGCQRTPAAGPSRLYSSFRLSEEDEVTCRACESHDFFAAGHRCGGADTLPPRPRFRVR